MVPHVASPQGLPLFEGLLEIQALYFAKEINSLWFIANMENYNLSEILFSNFIDTIGIKIKHLEYFDQLQLVFICGS